MPHQTTPLASGTLNGSDQLIIELVECADYDVHATVVAIRWPSKVTLTTPVAYDQVAAAAMRLLANATVELAAIKVWKRL